MTAAANARETEAPENERANDLAICMAMDLLALDEPWTIEDIAEALGRDVVWLTEEINRAVTDPDRIH